MHNTVQTALKTTGTQADMPNLPQFYRLRTFERVPDGHGRVRNVAEIFNRKTSLRVQWTSRNVDALLLRGRIVMPQWLEPAHSSQGALHIKGLSCALQIPDISLAPLTPDSWVGDTSLLTRLENHWHLLSPPYRLWFNALFWNQPGRLYRFMTCPGSMHHHHNFKHGTLAHTLECADIAMRMAETDPAVDKDMIRFACLVHDVGKSDEYIPKGRRWHLSQRGRLLGHKVTIVQWLSETWQVAGIDLPTFERVLHILTATRGCKWNDTREPQLREATYLSHADRLSAELA